MDASGSRNERLVYISTVRGRLLLRPRRVRPKIRSSEDLSWEVAQIGCTRSNLVFSEHFAASTNWVCLQWYLVDAHRKPRPPSVCGIFSFPRKNSARAGERQKFLVSFCVVQIGACFSAGTSDVRGHLRSRRTPPSPSARA